MSKIFYSFLFVLLLLGTSCSGTSKYNEDNIDSFEEDFVDSDNGDYYEDGTYCAEIEYYNPNTGTSNSYTLSVEVESNELTTIYWGNGGWLDEDHFSSEELDSDGSCSFTSDKGYEYTVTIIGTDC
jgi:hypothetical protein